MPRSFSIRHVVLAAAVVVAPVLPLAAQHAGHGGHAHGADTSAGSDAGAEAERAMGGHHDPVALKHLAFTPVRAATPADSTRAADVIVALREAIGKYRDVRLAEADGYALFAPQLKTQRVYHYTRRRSAIAEAFRFDPAQPTSLLYVKDAAGRMVLRGAMYTAPARTGVEELDRRVPTSMARWHRHVSICIPPRGARERWAEKTPDGTMRFGPAGAIATKEECASASGRWLPSLFGWMVHVNAFAADEREIFEH